MDYFYRPFGLFFLLLMILLGIQLGLKKPICIESSVVYKIDKIGAHDTESIYNCSQLKIVPFSIFFFREIEAIQTHIFRAEAAMRSVGISNSMYIVIDEVNKDIFQELTNGVQIGVNLLDGVQLEKLLIIQGIKNLIQAEDRIFAETLSDFLLNDSGYQNLVSRAWGESFKDLNLIEKLVSFKATIQHISAIQLKGDYTSIERLKFLIPVGSGSKLSALFDKHLSELGYYSDRQLETLRLDFIIEDPVGAISLKNLIQVSKEFGSLKTAIRNTQGLFLLPSLVKVPKVLEQKMASHQRLVFRSGIEKETEIASYLHTTDCLIFINAKGGVSLDIRSLYLGGVSAFLSQNKDLEFVQIHLPSYEIIYKNLSSISNYFDFVKNRKNSAKALKMLGWGQSEWLTDLRAFKPIANYDVIQYFRVN